MRPRDHILRAGERASGSSVAGGEMPLREFCDHVDPAGNAHRQMIGDGETGGLHQLMDPCAGPGANCRVVAFGRLASLDQIFGDFPVLLDCGTRRKRKRVLRVGKQADVLSGVHALKTGKRRRGGRVKSTRSTGKKKPSTNRGLWFRVTSVTWSRRTCLPDLARQRLSCRRRTWRTCG